MTQFFEWFEGFGVKGTIKGKEINNKKLKLYKVLTEDMNHNGMQYKEGYNEDILPFEPKCYCKSGGLSFKSVNNIFSSLESDCHIREVFIDDNL